LNSGVEAVGDEDVARALVSACKGAAEPVLNAYDQLLSNGAILPSPSVRLRMLRSVLVVLREWAMSVYSQRIGSSATGHSSLILGGGFSSERAIASQGIRDKITSAANRFSLLYTFIYSYYRSSLFVGMVFYNRFFCYLISQIFIV